MAELNIPRAHSNSWYDARTEVQDGYYQPWRSNVGEKSGEDGFLALLWEHLTEDKTVLEVGCGHGELARNIADDVGEVVAYDRVAKYIQLAESQTDQSNVRFECYDAMDSNHEEAHPRSNGVVQSRRKI